MNAYLKTGRAASSHPPTPRRRPTQKPKLRQLCTNPKRVDCLGFFFMATDQPLSFSGRLQYSELPSNGRCEALLFRDIGSNMAENSDHVSFIRLTAQIVSAYLSNNSVPNAEIAALINQIHSRVDATFEP